MFQLQKIKIMVNGAKMSFDSIFPLFSHTGRNIHSKGSLDQKYIFRKNIVIEKNCFRDGRSS